MAVLTRVSRHRNGCVYLVNNDFTCKIGFYFDLWQYYNASTSELFQICKIKSLRSSRFKIFN